MTAFDALGSVLFRLPGAIERGKAIPEGRVKQILVIRIDSLGDGILTLPAVQHLKKRFPNARIDFLVSASIDELYRILFPGSTIHVFERNWLTEGILVREAIVEFLRFAKRLSGFHYDLAIDFRGDLRTILLMKQMGAPSRWGREGTGGRFLLTRSVPHSSERHEVFENLALVLENGAVEATKFPRIPMPRQASELIEKILQRLKGVTKIIIHPGAGYASKRWPTGNFVELAKRIQKTKLGIPIFVGTEKEKKLLAAYESELRKDIVVLAGKTSLNDLLAVLAQGDLFIGNDSGPAHLGALMGLKLVVVFSGTNDFRKWAPWSSTLRIVNHPVPCSPCGEKICPLERHFCMEDISVDEVLRAVEEMLHG